MIIPSLLPGLSPIVLYFIIFLIMDRLQISLSWCNVIGCYNNWIVCCLSMTAGGGAWDNAKNILRMVTLGKDQKHIKAVTGDTVGDPYKDTAGPAVNPMIKITNIVALLLLAVIAS